MFPKLFEWEGFFLPTYGLLVALGFILGLWMTSRLARRVGLNADAVINLGVYCALAGLIGAKLLIFVLDWRYYAEHPSEILSLGTLQAGGVFYGGLIAAIAVAWYYMRKFKLPGLKTADVFAPGVAAGHAIGRVGCFAAGCCYGTEAHLPWAVVFRNMETHQMFGTPVFVPLHPTQLYEAFAEAAIFLFLLWQFRKPHKPGWVIGWYLILYSAARFIIEFFRAHEQGVMWGLSPMQWVALGLLAAGIWLVALRREAPGKT